MPKDQTFLNQHFLAGIFMVPIGIDPVFVQVSFIRRVKYFGQYWDPFKHVTGNMGRDSQRKRKQAKNREETHPHIILELFYMV